METTKQVPLVAFLKNNDLYLRVTSTLNFSFSTFETRTSDRNVTSETAKAFICDVDGNIAKLIRDGEDDLPLEAEAESVMGIDMSMDSMDIYAAYDATGSLLQILEAINESHKLIVGDRTLELNNIQVDSDYDGLWAMYSQTTTDDL